MNTTLPAATISQSATSQAAIGETPTSSSTTSNSQASVLGDSKQLFYRELETPLGAMLAMADASHLYLLEFTARRFFDRQVAQLQERLDTVAVESASQSVVAEGESSASLDHTPLDSAPLDQIERELQEYFSGQRSTFETPFQLLGTEFQMQVWQQLCKIPTGETWSYIRLAKSLGRPTASRAVARANATNRLAIIVPCHRVIAADGSLAGYAGGIDRKQHLLELEGALKPGALNPNAPKSEEPLLF